jgi:transcriptional regulator with AAA-type ATPase domain/tetratricopeptide (TPR) repeat protein
VIVGTQPSLPEAILSHPRYEPGEVLGKGAQGVVLRVIDREAPARPLVAKVLRARATDEFRLAGEFALLARLRIRGVVRAHDFARDERTGAPFFVEDFVDGHDAAAWVAEARGSQANARLLGLAADVAAALAGLHDAGFTHGDLKPAHVRVVQRAAGAHAVLLDLGAAASRGRGGDDPGAFTPAYAAPEVRAGERATSASDLYGLGALAWAVATARPPPPGARPRLRSLAPWVQPALADVIEEMLATHPRDRPADAVEVLRRLGAAGHNAGIATLWAPPPIGRERELDALRAPSRSGVRYVVGPSGAGKSHMLRELFTRALLEGRDARLVAFPTADSQIVPRLVTYFRGAEHAWPFVACGERTVALLALDDLHEAPPELVEALDSWRCRPRTSCHPEVVATARAAPDGAEVLALGPLDDDAFVELCGTLGIEDVAAVEDAARTSDRSPGWLVASRGRVPVTRDTVLERVSRLSPEASRLFATVALCGGAMVEGLCHSRAVAELLQGSLVTRRARGGVTSYALAAPALCKEIAAALVTFEIADGAADAFLDGTPTPVDADASALLALAQGPVPPSRREELLDRAAARARAQGLRSEEMDALFALAAVEARRDTELLCRLERLTRAAGGAVPHPQVLVWLDEAAKHDATLRPLALRRRAECAAREGNTDSARALAGQAREAARTIGDPIAEALAIATMGAVALWRADWVQADAELADARARLASLEVADAEEVARLDHNFGVVALYRGRTADAIDAFKRALGTKRRLGDRAGVRSCLLNLSLGLTKAGAYDEAVNALDEAIALARSLGQKGGRAWCLAARAEIEVRRRRPAEAERWIAEAEALGNEAPPVVQADVLLLRAQVALLEGDGWRVLDAVSRIDSGVRAEQALIDTRARVLEAEGHLARLPTDHRRAARIALDAVRRARAAALPEVEAQALAALRAARGRKEPPGMCGPAPSSQAGYPLPVGEMRGDGGRLWEWLADVAKGRGADDAALALARIVAGESGAERAFVASVEAGGRVARVWGVDLDGIPLASPEQRLDMEVARAALGRETAVYQRDVETPAGRGSRLAVSAPHGDEGPRSLVVAEHRFQSGRFDGVRDEDARRWATLAGVLVRFVGQPEEAARDTKPRRPDSPSTDLSSGIHAPTTVMPMMEPRRLFPAILGAGSATRRALAKLDAAIDGELPVLLVGETGTGKELFARALHEHGPRGRGPFVAVNCGAIPDALFEAELFGHMRGSFTGAERARPGLIARAEGGTLLLDEIGELPLPRQAALLRALETRSYRPVGSDDERTFDVRVVASTNRDLERGVETGTFRRDLLYRLNVVQILVPPLRERTEDIPLLAQSFLKRAGSSADISPDAMATLASHGWPGNVRELEHVMQRLAGAHVAVVRLEHLPRALRTATSSPEAVVRTGRGRRPPEPRDERAEVQLAVARSGGNISHAARALGLTRQGLKKRMARLGMRSALPGPGRAGKT